MTESHDRKYLMKQYGFGSDSLEYLDRVGYDRLLLKKRVGGAMRHRPRANAKRRRNKWMN